MSISNNRFCTILYLGDAYKTIKVDMRNLTEIQEGGLRIKRCDYYYYPKCYCFSVRYNF